MAKSADHVVIFDTTLRDGEQSPGCSMNLEEKLRVAEVLSHLNVDVIEAGFPAASNGDFDAVQAVAGSVKDSIICGLARASRRDIERAAEALKQAKRARIHTFISTSALHMKHKLQLEPEEVHALVVDSVTYARNFAEDVEWSPEDGSRTDHDFLCRCVESAIDAGASTINIPDTVGYAIPSEFADLISMLRNRVPNIDKAVLSVHCHNDLGLAVANSLAAISAGARQVECTINGIGERAGNAAMEEIVMALRTRKDAMVYETSVATRHITRASRLLAQVTGFSVQPNKAVVGANAFAHESGIHQDGMLKHSETYEIMTPESVGLTKSSLVLGKHSGRAALSAKLRELGIDLGANQLNDVFVRFKELADKKKEVFEEDLLALADVGVAAEDERVALVDLALRCGTEEDAQAAVTLRIDGVEQSKELTGTGPVDAVFKGIAALVPGDYRLELFQVSAVTGGTDAQADVTVRLEENGRSVTGHAADTDTMVAAARAYITALNRLFTKRQRGVPPAFAAQG
jgi:2-isopropylmalate synthase